MISRFFKPVVQARIAKDIKLAKAMSHPMRLRMCEHIQESPGTNLTMLTKYIKTFPEHEYVGVNTIHQQLKYLLNAKVVVRERHGREKKHYINERIVFDYLNRLGF